MSKVVVRFIFLIPAIAGLIAAFHFYGNRPLPQQAVDYVQWYMHQSFEAVDWYINKLSFIGLIGLLLSTVGLLLFWGPARYIYVVSLLLTMPDQAPSVPILITGWEHFLDNLAGIGVGLNLGLMFSQPVSTYFERATPDLN